MKREGERSGKNGLRKEGGYRERWMKERKKGLPL